MFKFINRIMRRPRAGQVAIILILAIGIGIIFYAVSVNLGSLSQNKLMTTLASNIGASQLASSVASYGQSLRETMLDGQTEFCKYNGVLGAILTFFVVVIGVILSILTGGAALPLLIMAIALSAASVAVQITVIEPGFVDQWNSQIADTMDTQDAFVEQALQTGLENLVNDPAKVPDVTDSDRDRVFGFEGNEPKDTVSRFGVYYTARLKTIQTANAKTIGAFLDALEDFLYIDSSVDDWGLNDPLTNCYGGPRSRTLSECNPCCLPAAYRPSCCDCSMIAEDMSGCMSFPSAECGTSLTCAEMSPYYANDNIPHHNYEYVYDPVFENFVNTVYSFRELIGRDDAHQYFYKDSDDPNAVPQTLLDSADVPGFHLDDTTGFYGSKDIKLGIFPFFYKIADWGVDLTGLDYSRLPGHLEHCYWYDSDYESGCRGISLPNELDSKQLHLPYDPRDLTYNINPYVDSTNDNKSGQPPLAADKIILPGAEGAIVAGENECAQTAFDDPAVLNKGFWKKGDDRFCSSGDSPSVKWPYDVECSKGEKCTGSGATWPDDVLDDLHKELAGFIYFARNNLLSVDNDTLVKSFADWYEDLAPWIEKKGDEDHCYMCNLEEEGHLYVIRDQIQAMVDRLEHWQKEISYAGENCNEVWCVPPLQETANEHGIFECPGVSEEEAETFDKNGNGIRGDMEDITACLDWNVNDPAPTSGPWVPTLYKGNDDKFRLCGEQCNSLYCSDLPRSLVPNSLYNPSYYMAGNPLDEPDIQKILKCFDQCSEENCWAMPLTQSSDSSQRYFSRTLYALPEAILCDGGRPSAQLEGWIIDALKMAGPSCDLEDDGWLTRTRESALEAGNQVAKFEQRRVFLANRLAEIDRIKLVFDEALKQFNSFLGGPVADLIEARKEFTGAEEALPSQVIYGWKDEGGLKHVVRLDAALPGRCGGTCNVDQEETSDPQWPKICSKGEDAGWSLGIDVKICYYLCDDNGGVVKFRATRWDEAKDPETSSLSFPQGIPIWTSRLLHPDRGDVSDVISQQLENCFSEAMEIPDPDGLPADYPKRIYRDAFILNSYVRLMADVDYLDPTDPKYEGMKNVRETCWYGATQVLSYGVSTATCAKYYKHGGMKDGMSFHFLPCKHF